MSKQIDINNVAWILYWYGTGGILGEKERAKLVNGITDGNATWTQLYSHRIGLWGPLTRGRVQPFTDGIDFSDGLFRWCSIFDCIDVNNQRTDDDNYFDDVFLGITLRPVRVQLITLLKRTVIAIYSHVCVLNERWKLRGELFEICDG